MKNPFKAPRAKPSERVKFKALRTPEEVFGNQPWIFVAVTTEQNTKYNSLFAEFIRGLLGLHLAQKGYENTQGCQLGMMFRCAAFWRVANPAEAALEIRQGLATAGILHFCHVGWWDAAEGIFRDVNIVDGKTFGDLWPEIECYDGLAEIRRKADEGKGQPE